MATRTVVFGLLFALGAIGLGAPGLLVSELQAAAPARKQLLVLYDEDKDLPGLAILNQTLRSSFHTELGNTVEFHTESLNLSQFDGPTYDQQMAEHYRRKYAGKALDLVVAVMEPSLDFLLRHRERLFSDVPIVFCGVDSSALEGKTLGPNVTGILLRRQFAPTLDVALRLQPRARNVFVVEGASAFDRRLQTIVRRDLQPYVGRVALTYLVGLPMDTVLKRVASLPPDSLVLYVSVFADGAGLAFVPHDAAAAIATAANAPVYVFVDQYVGRGVVGGNVYSLDTHGRQVAELGLQILRGVSPAALPVRELRAQANMFDARQLKRWGLDATQLPADSVMYHLDPSVWELYRWYLLGAIALVVSQSALIAGLLVARARRRRAEAEARRQREELAHVLRVTTLGELTTSLAHEISQPLGAILTNAQAARRLLDRSRPEVTEVREALGDIAADAQRASQIIRRLRTLFRKEHLEAVAVDVNALIADVVGLLRTDMLTRRIEVRLALDDTVPFVLGDPVLLEQVFLNVVVNAGEAILVTDGDLRAVTIETTQPSPGKLAVTVRDTGVGVKAADLERIFEHFVSTKPQGLGMGLAISRSILTAHGGRIWATANADHGLTVHIELPCGSETPGRNGAGRRHYDAA